METPFINKLQTDVQGVEILQTLKEDSKLGRRFIKIFTTILENSKNEEMSDKNPYWYIYVSVLATFIVRYPKLTISEIIYKAEDFFFYYFNFINVKIGDTVDTYGYVFTSYELNQINKSYFDYALYLASNYKKNKEKES